MRRWMAASLTLLLLIVAGCSTKSTEPPKPTEQAPATPAPKPVDPVTIRFLSLAWQKEALEVNKELVAAWNKANPEIQVEYVQGDWASVQDYLLTSFEGNDPPDLFHYESAPVIDFGRRGYLADLAPLLPEEMKKDITQGFWDGVKMEDGKIYGVPFLAEPLIVLYNKKAFAEAGITPSTTGWTWDELRDAAKKLTKKGADGKVTQWGAVIPLKSPTNRIMNLSLNWGGQYFYKEGGKSVLKVGDAEQKVMTNIHEMLYLDKSTSPDGISQGSAGVIPGFLAGQYAMVPGVGAFARQQIFEQGAKDFEWGVMPPLKGTTQNQGAQTQTISIAAKSKHKEAAMKFMAFFLNTENMAKLAKGDWLLPTRASSMSAPMLQTEENGWKVSAAAAKVLINAPFQFEPGYNEYKSKVSNPVLTEYFSNQISLADAVKRLQDEGNAVMARYQK